MVKKTEVDIIDVFKKYKIPYYTDIHKDDFDEYVIYYIYFHSFEYYKEFYTYVNKLKLKNPKVRLRTFVDSNYREEYIQKIKWDNINDFDSIPNSALPKRAIQIASAGKLSLCLLSNNPRAIALHNAAKKLFPDMNIIVISNCKCGQEQCECSNEDKDEWIEFINSFDFHVGVNKMIKSYKVFGESPDEKLDYYNEIKHQDYKIHDISISGEISTEDVLKELNAETIRMLKFYKSKYNILNYKFKTLLKLAKVISLIDRSVIVQIHHINEAANFMV